MHCPHCGKENRGMAVFCAYCGKAITQKASKQHKPLLKSTQKRTAIIAGIAGLALILIVVIANSLKPTSLVGSWETSDGRSLSFSENGTFTDYGSYGNYTLFADKSLTIMYTNFEDFMNEWTLDYGESAKTDEWSWYIAGKTLYFRGRVYHKTAG